IFRSLSLHSSLPLLYLHSFPTRRSSDLLRLIFRDHLRQPGYRRLLEEIVQRQLDLEGVAQPGDELERQQGVPTQLEEIIVDADRSEEHTSELQSRFDLVCRLLLEKKKKN